MAYRAGETVMDHSKHLRGLLEAAYRKSAYNSGEDRSRDTNIHVSNLINFCPRAYYLCRKHNRSYHGFSHPGIQMGWTFDMGHALQKIQVKRLMTQGVIYGGWECRHCKYLEYGLQEDRRPCPKCKCRSWRNKDLGIELAMPLETNPASSLIVRGNVDYVIAQTPTQGYVVDAKSIKAEDFDVLTDAHLEYKRQVRLYMWLAAHKERRFLGAPRSPEKFTIDAKNAAICYCVKGARKDPFKVFSVPQDSAFIAGVRAKILSLKKSIEEDTPPIKICKSQANLMAKACTARTLCFGDEHGRA